MILDYASHSYLLPSVCQWSCHYLFKLPTNSMYSMYTLCLRYQLHLLSICSFMLCVWFGIVPDNPFGVVILFFLLSAAKLPIYIYLPSLLHTTLVRSFPFCFRKFSTVLSIFWSEWKRLTSIFKLWSSAVSLLHMLCDHRSEWSGL